MRTCILQILSLRASGANLMFNVAIPKFAAQAIRKIYDIGWKPIYILNNVSSSVGLVMRHAGPEKSTGIISAAFAKDPTDPQWQDTVEYKEWLAWMKKYNASGNVADVLTVFGYSAAQTMVAVLKQCGNNLTRENLMKQAASIDPPQVADAAARRHCLDRRRRFRANQADAIGEVRRHYMAVVWRGHLGIRHLGLSRGGYAGSHPMGRGLLGSPTSPTQLLLPYCPELTGERLLVRFA